MRTRKCCRCVTTRLTLTWKYFVKNKRGKKKKNIIIIQRIIPTRCTYLGQLSIVYQFLYFPGQSCTHTAAERDGILIVAKNIHRTVFFFFLLFFISLIIFRNKKRFHHQALVEIRILDHLRRRDKDGLHNVIHMLDYFYFRSHLCISFELLR